MLRRRWRWVGGMILAGSIVGAIICRTATPLYTASAELLVQTSGGMAAVTNSSQRQAFIRTQQQLLTSGSVMAMAMASPGVREMSILQDEAGVDPDSVASMKRLIRVDAGNSDDLLRLTCQATDGHEATRLIAALVDSFVRFESGMQSSGDRGSSAELHRQLVDARTDWKVKWATLQKFDREQGISSGDEQIDAANAALHALGLRLAAAHVETASAKASFDEIQQQLQDDPATTARLAKLTDDSAYADGDLASIEQQISAQKNQLSGFAGHFMANYPAVQTASRKLADLKLARAAIVRHRLQTNVRCEADLQASFADQQAKAAAAQTNQKTFMQLQADAAESEKQMGIVQAHLKALDPTDNALRAIVTVTEPPTASFTPTSPRVGEILGISAAIGLMIGLCLAGLVDQRVTTEQLAGMAILARLPAVQRRHLSMSDNQRIHPAVALSDACKAVHRRLEALAATSQNPGVGMSVAITSSRPGEGKSTFTSLLAATLVRAGRRVVVIDANFHSPVLGRLFSVEAFDGLADFLSQEDEAEINSIHPGRDGQVDVLTAGNATMDSHDLLNSERFTYLINELVHAYDFVLIDSPADALGSDAQVIAANIDQTIVLANEMISGRKSLRRLRERLSLVGGNVMGVVLNSGFAPVSARPAKSETVEPVVMPVDVTRRAERVAASAADAIAGDAFEAARQVEREVRAVSEMDFAEQIASQWDDQSDSAQHRFKLPSEEIALCVACAALACWSMHRGMRAMFAVAPMMGSQKLWFTHALDSVLWLAAMTIMVFLSRSLTRSRQNSPRDERSVIDIALTLFAQVSIFAAGVIIASGRSSGTPAILIIAAALSSFIGACIARVWMTPTRSNGSLWVGPMVVAIAAYLGAAAGNRLPGWAILHGAVRALCGPSPMAYAGFATFGALVGAWVGRATCRIVSESQINEGRSVVA